MEAQSNSSRAAPPGDPRSLTASGKKPPINRKTCLRKRACPPPSPRRVPPLEREIRERVVCPRGACGCVTGRRDVARGRGT
eukprot:3683814-Prymnesium_polylepis.1